MNEEKLDRKQLAAIRLESRRRRISTIRKKTVAFALSIAVVFTALVIATQGSIPGLAPEPAVKVASLPATTTPTMGYEEDDDYEEEEEDEEYGASAPKTQSSGQFFTSDTAAPVQSSQS